MNDRQTPFFPEFDDARGEVFIADAATQLPIESIDGDLPQRVVVNILDGASRTPMERSTEAMRRRANNALIAIM